MAVPVEGFSVLIRNETLESRHPGGVSGYVEACPNQTFCTDGLVCRVGFMNALDLGNFLAELESLGLSTMADDPDRDVAVVCQEDGLDDPCDWLQLGRHSSGVIAAWLTGEETVAPQEPRAPRPPGSLRLSCVCFEPRSRDGARAACMRARWRRCAPEAR